MTAFAAGDAVFGATSAHFTGGYADYAVAPAKMIAKKPNTLSDLEAASVPVVAVTAWQMLFDYAGREGGTVGVVNGGAGNVGGYAVQLARRYGLRVIAGAFEGDAAFVRALGANEVVDPR